jgi:hypothetical protein
MSGGADLDAGMLAGAGCGDLDKLAWLAGKDGHLVDVVDGVRGWGGRTCSWGGSAGQLDRPDKAGRTPM